MSVSAMTDHDRIREWIETRGGHPARLDMGTIGVDFGQSESPLGSISWDEFFTALDHTRDSFLHHDQHSTGH